MNLLGCLTFKHSRWLVGLLYRPPNSDITFFDKLQNACDSVQPHLHNYEGVILLGDFNINWQIDSASTAHLQEIANSLELTQVVEDVTRPSNNSSSSGSTIDLIFTNRPEKFAQVESFANPVSSDHQGCSYAGRRRSALASTRFRRPASRENCFLSDRQ